MSFSARYDNRTEIRWTMRRTDRSAEEMAKFEVGAAVMREQASQPCAGAALRAAITEDAGAFALDEPTDYHALESRLERRH